ncbi:MULTISPECIES: hypothetical protein [unclassified Tenacibaculum]|uniref:hypothetical protein n=1 Tax=unclassified Tenacibaculum TaxID=2635139 RepID=UPI001F2EDBBC|nr:MULTISPECIES: hypothetical protein [unclassified Tenacibaculum]MCF2875204.1 hypothetical protein [Tenacibaculum sp. Cn5-1]MCF2935280.1 hypothetical protein [Tenacibaculum sp. Cn5-34]MCG7511278.1 hypothetical protein [Tenacibaculum sp. Cn5-46]
MKNSIKISQLLLFVAILIQSCAINKEKEVSKKESIKRVFNTELGIEAVPSSLGKSYQKHFDRYTKVMAPNGKPIHIVIQDDVTDEQAVRCRGILEHYLKDYPGSKFGENKDEIANKMTENNAVLALMNGQDDGTNDVKVNAQPLYKNEIQVEGHPWYVNQNYKHRDAAYEEILHFVHDNGIGVDGKNNTLPGAAPEFQKEIRAAQVNGLEKKLWANDERMKGWLEEISAENSLSQEYLASVIDTYYGLWGAFKKREGGMWGFYAPKERKDLKEKDPVAYELMQNTFFHPYLTYNARIDKGFEGNFSLKFNEGIPYTHHSQYLKDITLLGTNNTNVVVNELDNDITGNKGVNTVLFSGNYEDYEVIDEDGEITVIDKTSSRDGKNTLRNVEKLQFLNKTIEL